MSFKSVLITGANRGIGLEFVRQLISHSPMPKYIIAAWCHPQRTEDIKKLASKQVHVIPVNAINYSEYDKTVKQIENIVGDDGIDLLINNAGILERDNLDNFTVNKMKEQFEVNAVTPLMITKSLLPLLKISASKRKTAIVNMASKMGSNTENVLGEYYAYRSSKAALNIITKSLSIDLKPHGISVYGIHSGWVKTELGGMDAYYEPSFSVTHMINTIKNVNDNVTGKIINFDGEEIQW